MRDQAECVAPHPCGRGKTDSPFSSLPCYVLKVSLRAPAVTPGSKDVDKE